MLFRASIIKIPIMLALYFMFFKASIIKIPIILALYFIFFKTSIIKTQIMLAFYSKLPLCRHGLGNSDLKSDTHHLSEQLYKSGRIRPTLSTGQFSNLSKNQCYISRWTLWHIKFGAVTKTEALGVISSFRGWISLYRASRQNVLFFSRYAE